MKAHENDLVNLLSYLIEMHSIIKYSWYWSVLMKNWIAIVEHCSGDARYFE